MQPITVLEISGPAHVRIRGAAIEVLGDPIVARDGDALIIKRMPGVFGTDTSSGMVTMFTFSDAGRIITDTRPAGEPATPEVWKALDYDVGAVDYMMVYGAAHVTIEETAAEALVINTSRTARGNVERAPSLEWLDIDASRGSRVRGTGVRATTLRIDASRSAEVTGFTATADYKLDAASGATVRIQKMPGATGTRHASSLGKVTIRNTK